jgi:hypothetical protein
MGWQLLSQGVPGAVLVNQFGFGGTGFSACAKNTLFFNYLIYLYISVYYQYFAGVPG